MMNCQTMGLCRAPSIQIRQMTIEVEARRLEWPLGTTIHLNSPMHSISTLLDQSRLPRSLISTTPQKQADQETRLLSELKRHKQRKWAKTCRFYNLRQLWLLKERANQDCSRTQLSWRRSRKGSVLSPRFHPDRTQVRMHCVKESQCCGSKQLLTWRL